MRPAIMKKKLLVASLLALVAMGSLWLYSRSLEDEKAGGQKVAILVAAEDIPAGTRIKKNQIALREVPEAYVHQASLKKNDLNDIIGHPVADKIMQGQPLLWSDFDAAKKSSSSRRLSTAIQKGQRAITIPVDVSGSIAGMLRPGDHVDILGTFARNQGQDWATVTLLQNVLVLATGDMRGGAEGDDAQLPGGGPRTFSNITVSVDLEEAELLVFSMQRGPVSIALRSQDDLETVEDVPDKTFGDIFETARRTAFAKRRAKKIEALRTQ
jgi:pilus assembly protein CpaB